MITILGAGSYGTALAISIARNGHRVVMWGRNVQHMQKLAQARCNEKYLPGIKFPNSLELEIEIEQAVSYSRDILLVIPSHAFKTIVYQLKKYWRTNTRLAWATKGLEAGSGRLLQDVVRDALGKQVSLAVMAGPTFAKELAMGLPTAITVAATDLEFATDLQKILACNNRLRIYRSLDLVGVQIAGAVKNVIAIAAGISDGMGFGVNARAALITRGLVEMTRLGVNLGATAESFMGMAGLGDLVLTCTDDKSRNRFFGLLLGKGKSIIEAQSQIGQVVEGYSNTKEVRTLAQRYMVDMPITSQLYQILYNGAALPDAIFSLLGNYHISTAIDCY